MDAFQRGTGALTLNKPRIGELPVTRSLTKPVILLTATLTLSACATISSSRLNPLNWFGPSASTPLTAAGEIVPLVDPATRFGEVETRGRIAQIVALQIDRTPTGAIVRATGVASTAGQYNAELVRTGQAGGVLTLDFRVSVPPAARTGGAQATRQITVAKILDSGDLAGVRTIRVQAAQNAREARR